MLTTQSKLLDCLPICPEDFGAKGDGSDDYLPIVAACEAAALTPGKVVLLTSRSPVPHGLQTFDNIKLAAAATGAVAPGAGGAGALPATPAGYVTININGTARQLPYY